MKNVILPFVLLVLVSCSSNRDERFCDCLSISDELNTEAAKYSSKSVRDVSSEEIEALKILSKQKDSVCSPYDSMSGEEMLKKKKACK